MRTLALSLIFLAACSAAEKNPLPAAKAVGVPEELRKEALAGAQFLLDTLAWHKEYRLAKDQGRECRLERPKPPAVEEKLTVADLPEPASYDVGLKLGKEFMTKLGTAEVNYGDLCGLGLGFGPHDIPGFYSSEIGIGLHMVKQDEITEPTFYAFAGVLRQPGWRRLPNDQRWLLAKAGIEEMFRRWWGDDWKAKRAKQREEAQARGKMEEDARRIAETKEKLKRADQEREQSEFQSRMEAADAERAERTRRQLEEDRERNRSAP